MLKGYAGPYKLVGGVLGAADPEHFWPPAMRRATPRRVNPDPVRQPLRAARIGSNRSAHTSAMAETWR